VSQQERAARMASVTGRTREELTALIRRDVAFLRSCRLIDYSAPHRPPTRPRRLPRADTHTAVRAGLLVGVHVKVQSGSGLAEKMLKADQSPGLAVLESKTELQYVCIVDVLTVYTARKRAETFFNGTLCCCRNSETADRTRDLRSPALPCASLHRVRGRAVSCQPPDKYAARFEAFVNDEMASTC
jgi:hypothetical protein